jgi:hypothetical protein
MEQKLSVCGQQCRGFCGPVDSDTCRAAKKAGLADRRIYDLRSTFASRAKRSRGFWAALIRRRRSARQFENGDFRP